MGHAFVGHAVAAIRALLLPATIITCASLACISLVEHGPGSLGHRGLVALQVSGQVATVLRQSKKTLAHASSTSASALRLSMTTFGLATVAIPVLVLAIVCIALWLVDSSLAPRQADSTIQVSSRLSTMQGQQHDTESTKFPRPRQAEPATPGPGRRHVVPAPWKVIRDFLANVQQPPSHPPSPGSQGSILSPKFVTRRKGGITILMRGAVEPFQQNDVADVLQVSNGELFARVVLAEQSGGGIILETSIRFPVAYLQTCEAVAAPGGERPKSRRVVVYATGSSPTLITPLDGQPPFCTVTPERAGEGFVVWRGGNVEMPGAALLFVNTVPHGAVVNVLDAYGRLLGAMEQRESGNLGGLRPERLIHVENGVDAGLVLTAILATLKML